MSTVDAALPPASTQIDYLALGDSYSIGEGVPEAGRWPVQLARRLRADGIALARPQIIARTGWSTAELAAAIDAAAPLGAHGFVSLLIGVNDQYRGYAAADYRTQFDTVLARAIGLAGARPQRVLVLSIPDWGVTPFARQQGRDAGRVARELDACNAAAAAACAAREVAFVDITAFSRAHGAELDMLADDGLHPSTAMYRAWVELALPTARELLLGS